MNKTTQPSNLVKISAQSRVRRIIDYVREQFDGKKERTVTMVAIGGSIGKLVSTVEVIRSLIPGLHQIKLYVYCFLPIS